MMPSNRLDVSSLEGDLTLNILAVDDDFISLSFLQAQIELMGHHPIPAMDGQQAIDCLKSNPDGIDVILMDREMPVMDGLRAVRLLKDDPNLRHIPVIMVTGADSSADVKEGLDSGVFYYLTKPVEGEMLKAVLQAAIREVGQDLSLSTQLAEYKDCFKLIKTCKFEFSTLTEAEHLAAFAANCFPNPTRVLPGILELLINAVEHGNLGTGYERKSELIEAGIWRKEIERLQALPQHADKRATVSIAQRNYGTFLVVEDQGQGFEWQPYLQIDPARASDSHGRGIARARATSFDDVSYNEIGNKVVARVSHDQELEW